MRTIPAEKCNAFEVGGVPDERQGIVYYEKGSKKYPMTPRASGISLSCRDEPFSNLVPVLPWTVKKVERQGKLKSFYLCNHCSFFADSAQKSETYTRSGFKTPLCYLDVRYLLTTLPGGRLENILSGLIPVTQRF